MAKKSLLLPLKYPAWLIFFAGLTLTFLLSSQFKHNAEVKAYSDFEFASDQISLRIEEKLNSYALILRGAAALFDASANVTREDWQRYTEKLQASQLIAGIQGIGFSKLIQPDELQAHIAEIREQGFPDYRVTPELEREIYTSIVYLEPFNERNQRAFGFDMYSEPVRRAAMDQAQDTGNAALSGKVMLVQETDEDIQSGALMYVPVYQQGAALSTINDRRNALIGWSYSPYRMRDLMQGILGDWENIDGKAVGIAIYDGLSNAPEQLLYSNHILDAAPISQIITKTLTFNGHHWTLVFQHLGPYPNVNYNVAWSTLISGILFSLMMLLLFKSLTKTRLRAEKIAARLTEEVRNREAALIESEFRWRFAIEGSGDGLWDWNVANKTLFYSPQWKAMLGFEEHEIAHGLDEWENRIHPADRDQSISALEDYLSGKITHYAIEQRLRCKDGSWRWFSDRAVIVSRDDSGKPLRVIGTQSDITAKVALINEQKELLNRLKTIASRVPGMVYEYRLYPDGHACFPYASSAIEQIYRVTADAVKEDANLVIDILHPDDRDRILLSIKDSAEHLTPWQLEYRTQFADGTVRWLYGNALPHLTAEGAVSWYGFITDVTAQKAIELQLRTALTEAKRFREAMDYVSSYIYMKDTDSRYTYANQATLELFGCNAEQLKNSSDSQFFPEETVRRLRYIDEQVFTGKPSTEEIEVLQDNGQRRVYLEIKTPIFDDIDTSKITGLLGISTDITAIKDHERQLEHIAHYDALTNLPNRVLLADRIHQAMMQSLRQQKIMAIVYLDFDGFKSINDKFGHAIGDKFLMAAAERMRNAMRREDTLSRLGGDEFVAVLLNLDAAEQGEPLLNRLLEATSGKITIDGHSLKISASLGVSYFPQDDIEEADQLLRQADQAMYQAKQTGKGRIHIFDAELDRSVRSQHETLAQIRKAIENREFVLFYQPKVDMRHGKVIGAEALIRWQHPQHDLLAPGHFLPIIENHPLMVSLGDWVLETALQQMTKWQESGFKLPVSINISAEELRQENFVEKLKSGLSRYPIISPQDLELEVLETSALGDLQKVTKILERCRELGVNISLDDFGTGYSSLTYLKRLPASTIKIDQSFIRDLLHVPEDLAILDGVIELAMAFNRQVIAEGVETIAHGNMLLRVGCDLAQGYGIAAPMSAEALPRWVENWQPEPHWENTNRLDRELLPILYSGVEHTAWVELLEAALRNPDLPLPEINPTLCNFGRWLHNFSKSHNIKLNKLRKIHSTLHNLASQLSAQRNKPEFVMDPAIQQIFLLRDDLLRELDHLIETTSEKSNSST